MSMDDWAGGTNRRELILSLLTDKQQYYSTIKEDKGYAEEDNLPVSIRIEYSDALASRATAKELADVIRKLTPELAEETEDWKFKYNLEFQKEFGEVPVEEMRDKIAPKIRHLVDKYFSGNRWGHLIEGTREALYRFADINKVYGTSPIEAQKVELDDILINFTYKNKKVTTTILRKNRPFAVSDIGINKEESHYFNDPKLIPTHIGELERISSDSPLDSKLAPLIRKLKSLQTSGKDEIKTMHPDMLIGRISLKRLEGRKVIYKYWKEAHDDFNNYIEIQDAFHKALKGHLKIIGEQADDEKVMSEINAAFDEFFASKLEKSDNYIIEVPSKDIETDDKSVQAMILLSEFLKMYMMQADPKLTEQFEVAEGEKPQTAVGGEERYDRADWNPDISIERDVIRPGEDERTLAEQASIDIESQTKVIDKDTVTSIFGDIKSIRSIKRVDPLFYYAWGKGAFGKVPLFKKDIASIKRKAKKLASRIDIFVEPSELDRLEDYFDELEDAATDFKDTDKFYLPLTPKVADLAERDDVDERFKKLKEHFDALKKMMSLGGMKDKAWPTSATTRQSSLQPDQGTKAPAQHYEGFPGRDKKGKNVLDIMNEFTNEYEDYMEALVEAFVIPLSSKNMPFDDEVEFIEEHQMRILRDEMKHPDAFTTLLMRYHELETAAISPDALFRLTKLMETISKPALQRRVDNLVDEMENAAEALEEVFDFEHDKDMYIHFGTILQEIKEKNNINEDIEFKGKTSEEWAKKYDPKKTYPLDALESHIRRHKSTYESDDRMTRYRLIRKFFAALDSFDIVKIDLEAEVLEAHDNIRKMMNKPVYYNTSKVDNFDHVNYAIEVAKEDYKVDLNAAEIESIVSEFNSMEEIASKHGITQETVYFLKANFR